MALILVIEDDSKIRELITNTLTDHLIVEAATGEDGLRLVKKVRPNLIILDMKLNGGISGVDVCREFAAYAPLSGIPILAISGRSNANDISRFLHAGATSFLAKPFSLRELTERVDKLLELEVISITRILAAAGELDLVNGVKGALVAGNTIKIIRALRAAIQEIEAELKDKSQ